MKHLLRSSIILALVLFSVPAAASAAGVYPSSHLGYDLSFNSLSYPATFFNFGVIGVTHGKAFIDNDRLASEYSWARIGGASPTFYLNLNAPYGSTVAGNIDTPRTCDPVVATSTVATTTDPTACEGYNYGYNAAAHSLAYVKSIKMSSPFWWLDIEEANSWAPDTAVNDATIQGAIDYLNKEGIQAGIYSTPRMWKNIAGKDFVPSQTVGGKALVVPTWLPIGTATQVGATNACVTHSSFIPGSPVWLVQYEADTVSVDQNYSC